MVRLVGEKVEQWLVHLARIVWEEEKVSEDWVKQLTVPLHKKGSVKVCDNYRGIALLSVPGKVFCRVIQMRLAQRAEQVLRTEQCGFRKGRGCVDQIFTLRIQSEKAREYNTSLYLAFVDLRKAYDSVSCEALWMVLEKRCHLPCKLVRILKSLHERTKGAVRAYGKVSSEFDVTTGVRQGDVLAPVLFNLFLDAVIAATLSKHHGSGIRMLYDLDGPLVGNRKKMRRSVSVRDLEYADDMALVCDSMDALEDILRALDASCLGMVLAINPKKTKLMVVHPTSSSSTTFRPVLLGAGREPIEVVGDF